MVDHLRRALDSDDPFQKGYQINEGINKIVKRNKRLMLADRHGWATAEAYERDPIADDSSDEKRIKRAKKEAQSFLEEKARTKKVRVMSRKRNFRNSGGPRPFSSGFSFSNVYPQEPRSFPLTCWRCKRPGHFARFCQAPIPPNPARSEDNETILSRDRVLDIECDSDFNFSFDLDNFCPDARFVESNVKSVISSPPDEASPNVKDIGCQKTLSSDVKLELVHGS